MEWISVKDDLPEYQLTVQICVSGEWSVGHLSKMIESEDGVSYEWYDEWNDGKINWMVMTHEVTHWMLKPVLPSPNTDSNGS